MVRRSFSDRTLLTAASTTPRRSRLSLVLTMLVLLVLVLFVAFNLLPEGTSSRLAAFGSRPQTLDQARRLEESSLYRTAAEQYERILDSPRVSHTEQFQAALRVAELYQSRLGERAAAETALEKAVYFAPDANARSQAAGRLAQLRGYPVSTTALKNISADGLSTATMRAAPALHGTPAARLGADHTVTMEELVYAWRQIQGDRPPTKDEFMPFVQHYLDMVLLADEARRRGIDTRPQAAIQLNVQQTAALSRLMLEQMTDTLPEPSEEEIGAFYEANKTLWQPPVRAEVGIIEVESADAVQKVTDALAEGTAFRTVARNESLQADNLKEGYLLGEIGAADRTVPVIGSVPGLAPLITAMEDGASTGPLSIRNRFYWFKVLKKTESPVPSMQSVHQDLKLRIQARRLAEAREALIASLRGQHPVELLEAAQPAAPAAAIPPVTLPSSPTLTRAGTTPPPPPQP